MKVGGLSPMDGGPTPLDVAMVMVMVQVVPRSRGKQADTPGLTKEWQADTIPKISTVRYHIISV
jgi:hypothetical protein